MSQEQTTADPRQTFAVSAQAETATKTRIETRDFSFVIDEPPALGGEDAAPNPVEYLAGAWAGCLNVVAHVVAEEHGIEIDDLEIDVSGEIDPRKFLGETDSIRAGYQALEAEIAVETAATDRKLDDWIAAVEARCPVLDNLANTTPVETSITIR